MNFKTTTLAAAVALLALGQPVQAQSSKELEELRAEIRKLREEVNQLKKGSEAAKPADPSGWGEKIEQVEIKQKDAVVLGDIPGSFRLPGSETSVHIYGFAEAHLIHDFKGTAPGDDFTNLPEQPLEGSGYTSGKTLLTAQSSRFGFETSTPTDKGPFSTKLEADFYAYCSPGEANCNRNHLRLRLAYGDYAGWRIGQDWSTFMDLDDLPETVDFNGPIGAPFVRRTMVRYTYNDPQLAKFTFAAENPENGAQVPNLVARFDKAWDWGAVNVRALYHEVRVGSQTKSGAGIGIGGSYKLTDKDLLMGQYTHVNGDIDDLYGSNGYTVDAAGNILFDNNQGIVLGYARTWSDQMRSNLAFGMNKSSTAGINLDNKNLWQLHANLIYNPIKNVDLGAEYIYGERKTWPGEKGILSRIDLMGRYSF
jgi:hypothetical protein